MKIQNLSNLIKKLLLINTFGNFLVIIAGNFFLFSAINRLFSDLCPFHFIKDEQKPNDQLRWTIIYRLFWSIAHLVFGHTWWNEVGIDTWTWFKSNVSLKSTHKPYRPVFHQQFPNGLLNLGSLCQFWPTWQATVS